MSAVRVPTESAATTAAHTAWIASWDAELNHRFECKNGCPLIGFPGCSDGEQLAIARVMRGETLRRARLADEELASERWGYVIEPWARRLGW